MTRKLFSSRPFDPFSTRERKVRQLSEARCDPDSLLGRGLVEQEARHAVRDDLLVSRDLPSGTVTFLFTDIEGSTRLLDEVGTEAYADALAEHGRVIREACTAEGGVEVNTWGDAFFFAFPTAPGALAAAAAFTAGLTDGPIQVRVGVHTGMALHGEGGYIGHDVHRAARIAAAGHGGQVLVSSATGALVESGLTDLGEHRFKDLGAPERVYQLGDGEFPALKSLHRTNLPVPATRFLGRERELSELVDLVTAGDARVITVTGPGGTGKTRLSLQAAGEASDGFPDGVFWVPLAPLRDASLLEAMLAQALEVSPQSAVAIVDSIVHSFAGRRALVVVDNCEHLVDAVAGLIGRLAEGCPRVVFVASSRERLGLRFETVYAVQPMAPADCELLFCERASAVSPTFEADEHVASICAQVDGLPLAIELAAARTRALSTRSIRERLGERLALLKSRDRDLDDRQRTIEGAIAWSYDLLDTDEQRALRSLSVFAGGCTQQAAEEVAGADLDLVESLLDKSLIRHRVDEAGQDRYWMLETIREYLAARLAASAESDRSADAHRAFFVAHADQFGPSIGHQRAAEHFERFRADRANIEQALERSIELQDGEGCLRIVRFVCRHWYDLRELKDNLPRVRIALALDGGTTEDRAHTLVDASLFAGELGEVDEAREMLTDAEALFAGLGDRPGLAFTAARRAFLESTLGNPRDAIQNAERALEIALETDDDFVASNARTELAHALTVAATEADPPDRETLERALEIHTALLDESRGKGATAQLSRDANNVGVTLFLLGRSGEALQHVQEGLKLSSDAGHSDLPFVFNAALAAGDLGRHREGVTLAARVLHEWADQGVTLQAIDRRPLDRLEAAARLALGDEDYEAAVRAGEAMSPEEAVALALGLTADA